jgi:SAM-dependent methyltransferase
MNNAYFKQTSPASPVLDGYAMPPQLWIHPWMYAWALSYAKAGMYAADLGTGWHYRPFRYELARIVKHVYAVDSNREVLQQEQADNLDFIVADFTRDIPYLEPGSMDVVFFLHCLEQNTVNPGLSQAAKLIRPNGRIVLACDAIYDPAKPLGRWQGLDIDALQRDVSLAGLAFDGDIDLDKSGAVVHAEWNLCNFHGVLRHA